MLRSTQAVVLSGASAACAMAGAGVALYGDGPHAWAAAQLFGGFGLVAGLVCGRLHALHMGESAAAPERLSAEVLAQMLRDTAAAARAERQARPGSPADRRPMPLADAVVAAAQAAAMPGLAAHKVPSGLMTEAPAGEAPVTDRQFATTAFGD